MGTVDYSILLSVLSPQAQPSPHNAVIYAESNGETTPLLPTYNRIKPIDGFGGRKKNE